MPGASAASRENPAGPQKISSAAMVKNPGFIAKIGNSRLECLTQHTASVISARWTVTKSSPLPPALRDGGPRTNSRQVPEGQGPRERGMPPP